MLLDCTYTMSIEYASYNFHISCISGKVFQSADTPMEVECKTRVLALLGSKTIFFYAPTHKIWFDVFKPYSTYGHQLMLELYLRSTCTVLFHDMKLINI